MPSQQDVKTIQWTLFALLFVGGWLIVDTAPFVQLHEDGHITAAHGANLNAKQTSPNTVEVSGMAEPASWRRVYMAGYWQVAVTTGMLLAIGWLIACFTAHWWWMGALAGAHHHAWFLPAGSYDFAHLSVPDLNGWYLVAFACLTMFWVAFALQRKLRG